MVKTKVSSCYQREWVKQCSVHHFSLTCFALSIRNENTHEMLLRTIGVLIFTEIRDEAETNIGPGFCFVFLLLPSQIPLHSHIHHPSPPPIHRSRSPIPSQSKSPLCSLSITVFVFSFYPPHSERMRCLC